MEICVDSVISGINAQEGGAKRLELCSALSEGGLTPSPGLLKKLKGIVKIPIFVMIRPRGGDDFKYSEDEVEIMENDLLLLKDLGADGFVFGALTAENEVDKDTCLRLLKLAEGRPCTFHRAFDMTQDPMKSLNDIISLGFTRILTSGQEQTAFEGLHLLKELIAAAQGRIIIMPGSGVNVNNIETILKETKANEIHGSGKETMKLNISSSRAAQCSNINVTSRQIVASMVSKINQSTK